MRKAVELAKAGDVVMLKFLLGRILPRERPVKLELPPMEFADDAVEALGLSRAPWRREQSARVKERR